MLAGCPSSDLLQLLAADSTRIPGPMALVKAVDIGH